MLLRIYTLLNKILLAPETSGPPDIKSDDAMDTAFDGDIEAQFFLLKEPSGNFVRIPMAEAVETGLIETALNTYDVIKIKYPHFRSDRFNIIVYNDIAAINYYTEEDAAAAALENEDYESVVKTLASDKVRRVMQDEYNIVKHIYDVQTAPLRGRVLFN